MRVHLQGMGLTGCLMAHQLFLAGVDFTWDDTDAEKTAWKASTGAIYPCGEPGSVDRESHAWWYENMRYAGYEPHMEEAAYMFSSKQPPHKGKYGFSQMEGCNLNLASLPAMHLNAQSLVPATRIKFAAHRRAEAPAGARLIITHGFSQRRTHAFWGWTRLVRLEYSLPEIGELRPCIYLRPGLYFMAYAYPVPGTPWWYSGSSLIKQKGELKTQPILPKYDRWKEGFERLTEGRFKVAEEGPILEGWRPASEVQDGWTKELEDGTLICRPLWNSGIRHFPMTWATTARLLGLDLPGLIKPKNELART